jgi:hypothetical protein
LCSLVPIIRAQRSATMPERHSQLPLNKLSLISVSTTS